MAPMRAAFLAVLCGTLATSLSAQTQIGGGVCNSSNLTDDYTINLTGRQVTASGAISNAYFGDGTANFDGQSTVKITLTANTNQTAGTPVTYIGTYSVQANCQGTVTITSGDTATFTLAVYNQGSAFLVDGHDATYTFSGGGSKQPDNCLLATLAGVYAFSGAGYTLSGSALTGVTNTAGLVQFDGQGNVTASLTNYTGGTPNAFNAAGSYSIASTCVGTATVTDPSGNPAVITVSLSNASGADFLMIFSGSKFLISGSGHMAFGE